MSAAATVCIAVSGPWPGASIALGRAATASAAVLAIWGLGSVLGGLVYGVWHKSIPALLLLGGLSLATIPLALASSVWLLAALGFLAGLLCAPTITATVDQVSRVVPDAARGEAMGWHGSAMTAGSALGAPVAGLAIDRWGWGPASSVSPSSAWPWRWSARVRPRATAAREGGRPRRSPGMPGVIGSLGCHAGNLGHRPAVSSGIFSKKGGLRDRRSVQEKLKQVASTRVGTLAARCSHSRRVQVRPAGASHHWCAATDVQCMTRAWHPSYRRFGWMLLPAAPRAPRWRGAFSSAGGRP